MQECRRIRLSARATFNRSGGPGAAARDVTSSSQSRTASTAPPKGGVKRVVRIIVGFSFCYILIYLFAVDIRYDDKEVSACICNFAKLFRIRFILLCF